MANMLLNFPARTEFDLSSLKRIMLGGAAASPDLIRRMEGAFGCEVFSGYGLTETCPILSCSHQKGTVEYATPEERHRRQAMAGWSMPGMKVMVADIYGNAVPRDGTTIGEVLAQGDNVMAGYFNEPAETEAVLHDNWLHTGDMATWDDEGYLQIVDRKKEIIISGGENISSLEIERAIYSHESVFECAVVAAPDPQWGEVPAAIVYLKPGHALTDKELMEYLTLRLGRFKLPRIIEFTEEPLVKTGTGKVRKMVIRERFWAGNVRRVQG
jgi:fatty-acyl-CoA synthase